MIALIRNTLPAGLVQMHIGAECWTQRIDYPLVAVGKSVKSPPKSTVTQTAKKRTSKSPSVFKQLLLHIDDTFDLFTPERKESAERAFMDHIRTFIGHNPGRELMGAKASREILGFLAGKSHHSPPHSFFVLCSFLLDATLQVDDMVFTYDGITVTRTIVLQCKK